MSTLFRRWLSMMPALAVMLALSLSLTVTPAVEPASGDSAVTGIVTVDPAGYWERLR